MADGNGCLDPLWVIQSSVPLNTRLFSGITYDKWYNSVEGSVCVCVCVCVCIRICISRFLDLCSLVSSRHYITHEQYY